MPLFTIRFVNRSRSDQGWILGRNGQIRSTFSLPQDFESTLPNLDVNHDYQIDIAVNTDSAFAAAALVFTAATGLWRLETMTPGEWGMDQNGGLVTVRGFLNDQELVQVDGVAWNTISSRSAVGETADGCQLTEGSIDHKTVPVLGRKGKYMGQIISDIGKDIDSVVTSVTKLVTDVGAALTSLKGIAKGFAPPTMMELDSPYIITFDDPNDLPTALKNAMQGAKGASEAMFKTSFGTVTPAGTDVGVVKDYKSGIATPQCVIDQIKNDFAVWQIGANQKTIGLMANTIATNVQATMGSTGTAQGHHNLNMNQKIDWTVAYGLFQITAKSQGLVYAYTAALESSWGA